MIGRIQDKNVSVPLGETASSHGVSPNDSTIQDSEDRPAPRLLGVANVQDGFEQVNQDDLFEKIGLGTKSIVDPIGYPGEEWLWQNSEEL